MRDLIDYLKENYYFLEMMEYGCKIHCHGPYHFGEIYFSYYSCSENMKDFIKNRRNKMLMTALLSVFTNPVFLDFLEKELSSIMAHNTHTGITQESVKSTMDVVKALAETKNAAPAS